VSTDLVVMRILGLISAVYGDMAKLSSKLTQVIQVRDEIQRRIEAWLVELADRTQSLDLSNNRRI
jgi:hypothetical protein